MIPYRDIAVLFPRSWRIDEIAEGIDALTRAGVPRAEIAYSVGDTSEPCIDCLSPAGAESVLSRILTGDPVKAN